MASDPRETKDPLTMEIKVASCIPTEMGVRIDLRSSAANMLIELDLDQDPVYFMGLCEVLPRLVESALEEMRKKMKGESGAAEHTAVRP